jgi:hypothetical protein
MSHISLRLIPDVSSCELGMYCVYQISVHSHTCILSALCCEPVKYIKLEHKIRFTTDTDEEIKKCDTFNKNLLVMENLDCTPEASKHKLSINMSYVTDNVLLFHT